MLDRVKNEPVLLAAVLVAVVNLVLGEDSGLTVDAAETVVALVLGLVARAKVTPVRNLG